MIRGEFNMDDTTKMLADMGIELGKLAVQKTASTIGTKIKSIRTDKDLENTRRQYEEIINELLADRDEAIRIAMAYKDELDRLNISDSDIDYLHNTISRALDLMNSFNDKSNQIPEDQIEPFKQLISKETLKSMQLLGFNFRKAIGEPLTECCASFIESKLMNKNTGKTNGTKKSR